MHYHIYCKTKSLNENYLAAIKEFQKRLSAYCDTSLHMDSSITFYEPLHDNNHHILFLEKKNSSHTSEEFAQYINTLMHSGKSHVHILVGYCVDELFSALSSVEGYPTPTYASISNLDLSRETVLLMLHEQLYRGYTILQGKTYHK